jgi:hypothetical protein
MRREEGAGATPEGARSGVANDEQQSGRPKDRPQDCLLSGYFVHFVSLFIRQNAAAGICEMASSLY